jgi:type IV secretory pathway VirB9-like protein
MAGCSTQPPQVIVQQAPPPKPKIVIPDDPWIGLRPDVVAAIKSGDHKPLRDGITTIYEYSPDVQWPVDCAPMHATEVRLAPDETTNNNSVILGDPTRWSKKVSGQAVLVEPAGDFGHIDPTSQQKVPADPQMISTLTIVTSKRRSYHFLLRMAHRSTGAVEFRYPNDVKQQEAARDLALKEAANQQ